MSITWGSIHIGSRDFETNYHPEYGNCFTYNPNKTKLSTRAGEPHGLSMTLDGLQNSYICSSTMAGFRFQIHDQDVHPFPDSLGMFVPTKFQTSMAIITEHFHHLSARRGSGSGSCVAEGNDEMDFYSKNYSIQGCIRTCQQKTILQACGCAYPIYASPDNASSCGLDKVPCVEKHMKCYQTISAKCDCLSPCRNKLYTNTATKVHLRNNPILQHHCKIGSIPNDRCLKTIGNSIADVHIYFDQMSAVHYEEILIYEVNSMLSDFGGSMGIMIGASMITFTELVILPLTIICGIA